MTTERIYHQVRGETGLTDVKIDIYNASGTKVVSAASMTELGTTGIYYYDYTWTTSGSYLFVISSSILSYQDTEEANLGIAVTSYIPTTTVSYSDIKVDIGEAYNQIVGGTTSAVVTQIIGRAENDIVDITGTTVGYTMPIRYLSDAYTINHCLASMGPESNAETKLINMRDYFDKLTEISLRRKGKDIRNIASAWTQVNN